MHWKNSANYPMSPDRLHTLPLIREIFSPFCHLPHCSGCSSQEVAAVSPLNAAPMTVVIYLFFWIWNGFSFFGPKLPLGAVQGLHMLAEAVSEQSDCLRRSSGILPNVTEFELLLSGLNGVRWKTEWRASWGWGGSWLRDNQSVQPCPACAAHPAH